VPIFARVLGCAAAFEPGCLQTSNRTATAARGDTVIRRAIVGALHDAGLTPAELGCVIAHGMSAVVDDRLEAQAIRAVLGDVPVTAPKGNFGYLGAGSGALETAVSVLAIQHKLIPHTLNMSIPTRNARSTSCMAGRGRWSVPPRSC